MILTIQYRLQAGRDVHLRSWTTGLAHPKAMRPMIIAEFFDQQFLAHFLIRVCGPHVGILFDGPWLHQTTAALAIWDWRTGSQKMVFSTPLKDRQIDFNCAPAYAGPRVSLFRLHIG